MSTITSPLTKAATEVDVELDSPAIQAAALGMAVATGDPIMTGRVSKYKEKATLIAAHRGLSFRVAAFDKKGTAATLMYSINKNDGTVWGRDNVTFKAVVAKPSTEEIIDAPELAGQQFGVYVTATSK